METKWVKLSDNGQRIVVDSKRSAQCAAKIIASHRVLSLRPKHNSLFNKLGKRKRSDGCKTQCGRSLIKNYSDFLRSGLSQRLLFYQNGEWKGFPEDIIELIREDFCMKKAAIEVHFSGCHLLLDILYMLQVDLKTGSRKPIAWIDEAGALVGKGSRFNIPGIIVHQEHHQHDQLDSSSVVSLFSRSCNFSFLLNVNLALYVSRFLGKPDTTGLSFKRSSDGNILCESNSPIEVTDVRQNDLIQLLPDKVHDGY
ncbi:hypothetical protein Acr_12g0002930 [Actinidia rufa]|uniref:RCD1 WWE domain-containing protein n=1 Tax=Actinidia rufa TaxID=165716 RepID=A0A7J0FGC5_9ERIC|nr:hypothetical protein Acr_12g0002930 [Actinidia rufa]